MGFKKKKKKFKSCSPQIDYACYNSDQHTQSSLNFDRNNYINMKVNQKDINERSIFIKNLNHNVDEKILETFFKDVLESTDSDIQRITIVQKTKKKQRLYGYVEFTSVEAKREALKLNNSILDSVKVQIYEKRTNLPGAMVNYEEDEEVILISTM